MKRFVIVFMVLGLVAGSMTTAAAKRKGPPRVERTVEGKYGPYPAPIVGCNDPLGPWACMAVSTGPTDRFFTAKVTDAHGQPVFVEVDYPGGQHVATFCGETSEPIAINPGAGLRFHLSVPFLFADLYLDCPAHRIKTTGTISVTLSNLPYG